MKATSCLIVAFSALALGVRPVPASAAPQSQPNSATKTAPAPKAAPAKVDDKTLTDRIEAKLKADASLKKFDIDTSVTNAVATLTGSVRTQAEKDRAARVAHVTGITRVDNQIKLDKDAGKSVGQSVKEAAKATEDTTVDAAKATGEKTKEVAKTTGEKTKEVAKTTGEKTKEGAEVVGDKTKQAVSKTGEVITDGWITTRVHSNFVGEDTLNGSDINVDTANHVVTLKGTVKSEAGRARAIALAKKVEGVNRVIDHLTVVK
jgi:hyperosmotically inducible protein